MPESEDGVLSWSRLRIRFWSGSVSRAARVVSPLLSAESMIASAESCGWHLETSASTFSIGSSRADGSRSRSGVFQCVIDRGSGLRPLVLLVETCGRSSESTQRPSRLACVTQLSTTLLRAAKRMSGSAFGSATQPRLGRMSPPEASARRMRCREYPASIRAEVGAAPLRRRTWSITFILKASRDGPPFRGRSAGSMDNSHSVRGRGGWGRQRKGRCAAAHGRSSASGRRIADYFLRPEAELRPNGGSARARLLDLRA